VEKIPSSVVEDGVTCRHKTTEQLRGIVLQEAPEEPMCQCHRTGPCWQKAPNEIEEDPVMLSMGQTQVPLHRHMVLAMASAVVEDEAVGEILDDAALAIIDTEREHKL